MNQQFVNMVPMYKALIAYNTFYSFLKCIHVQCIYVVDNKVLIE